MIWNEDKEETVGVDRIFLNEIGKESIEFIRIVRCKECKYNDDGECIIKAGWFPVKPEWFCADGVAKE